MSTNPSAFGNAPTGPAGGSLSGTYPNPVLSQSVASSWLPSDAGLLAWSYDPIIGGNSTAIAGTGVVNLIRVNVRTAITATNVVLAVIVAGSTLTAAENFAGLYNSSGTLIGTTADQSTNWAGTGVFTTALTGGPFALPAGFYWVATVCNGTTGPSLSRAQTPSGAYTNLGLSASTARSATNGSGNLSLPASITPASNVTSSASYWAGIS